MKGMPDLNDMMKKARSLQHKNRYTIYINFKTYNDLKKKYTKDKCILEHFGFIHADYLLIQIDNSVDDDVLEIRPDEDDK